MPLRSNHLKVISQRSWLYIGLIVLAAAGAAALIWWAAQQTIEQNVKLVENQPQTFVPTKSTATPQITAEVVVSGHDHIWEVASISTKEFLFTERKGVLSALKDGQVSVVAKIDDVYSFGEGGLLGLAVDPDFVKNRFIYTCFNSTKGAPDVRVVRWYLKSDLSGLEQRSDIVAGIPSNGSGRHSGCRLAFGLDGYLWIGTGDIGKGDTSIQPKSLGGKVLRVDRDGQAAAGNLGGEYDSRIFSYGHRNVQGIAFFSKSQDGVLGVSVEHGSDIDDEVNLLKPGNFGWAPSAVGYNESGVPMTDKTRFPDAVDAIWSSGKPTQAPSGVAVLKGRQWKAWEGALAVAVLKDKHLKILLLDEQNKVVKEEKLFDGVYGRLRTAVQGLDGSLYISTDNGNDDKVIKLTPN